MTVEPGRIRALDGLRGIAALLVVVSHGFVQTSERWPQIWEFGGIGVRLFFVLSGAVITHVFYRAIIDGGQPGQIWRAFAARRALRILPLAYFAMWLAWLTSLPAMTETPWWYLTFTSNIGESLYSTFPILWREPNNGLRHFWTLAVEEQVYLLWPPLLLISARYRAWPWVVGGIVVAVLIANIATDLETRRFMFTFMDAFALGGLIGWSACYGTPRWQPYAYVGVGLAVIAASAPYGRYATSTAAIVLTAAAVAWAWSGERSTRWLATPVLVWFGTISYGLYVWHELGPHVVGAVGIYGPEHDLGRFIWRLGLGTAFASLTWYGFERPLNNLKRFFPYAGRPHHHPRVAGDRVADYGL